MKSPSWRNGEEMLWKPCLSQQRGSLTLESKAFAWAVRGEPGSTVPRPVWLRAGQRNMEAKVRGGRKSRTRTSPAIRCWPGLSSSPPKEVWRGSGGDRCGEPHACCQLSSAHLPSTRADVCSGAGESSSAWPGGFTLLWGTDA